MRKQLVAIGCLSAAVLAATPALVQELPTIKSTTVDLPAGDSMFPGGAAADAIIGIVAARDGDRLRVRL